MTRQRTPQQAPRAANVSEWDARAYHTVAEPQFAWGKAVLATVELEGTEYVLDAGCGTGRLTALLAERVQRGLVVGLDRSHNMTQLASSTLSQFGSRAAVVVADLADLPFAGAFDVVFSTATFHWVLDHDRLFASLFATLKAGGRMRAQCGGTANLARILTRANALAREREYAAEFAGWSRPSNFATAEDTRARLARAGFADIHAWIEPAPVTFADAAAFRAFVTTVVLRPYLARIDGDARRTAFVDHVVDAAARDEPAFTLDYWRLNIIARRP